MLHYIQIFQRITYIELGITENFRWRWVSETTVCWNDYTFIPGLTNLTHSYIAGRDDEENNARGRTSPNFCSTFEIAWVFRSQNHPMCLFCYADHFDIHVLIKCTYLTLSHLRNFNTNNFLVLGGFSGEAKLSLLIPRSRL